MTVGTKQAKAEREPSTACIRDEDVAAATSDREKGVVVRAVLFLRGQVAADED